MKVIQILAFPFSLLYGMVTRLRNFFYDREIFQSVKFNVPVICIGNLSLGGTGKSPHLEYIVELLGAENIATLSRGYGRKTSGFILVSENSTAEETGDEPLQFKKKFNKLLVAVCEDRVKGINELLKINPKLKAILLDDAFQHRKVKPDLSILLTDYNKPFYNDLVLPSGTLREPRSGFKRADIIIVTKIPKLLLDGERERIVEKIKSMPHKQIYFSKITYGDFKPIGKKIVGDNQIMKEFFFDATYSIVLFTGIANSLPLVEYLSERAHEVKHIPFPDHHSFSVNDIEKVCSLLESVSNKNKIILTTEKDAMRLSDPSIKKLISELPVYYVPIKIEFEEKDGLQFNQQILSYVK